jgi:RNA polymerase sigma-70 factor (ECF subfamily)
MPCLPDSQHEQFVENFIRYQDRVYAYIASLLPRWRDADDVFQQTSLKLWEKRQDFDPERDFLSWARGIALNVVRNHLRQASRDRLRLSEDVVEILSERRQGLHELFESRHEALGMCLDELLPEHASLLRRCFAAHARLQDIAAGMGISANALYLKLRRIRRALFDCINRRLAAEERS